MIETRRVGVRRLGAVAAGVVLLGVAGGLGACGDSGEAAEAVRVSALEIETLSLGGANPAPLGRDARLATLQKIVGRLRPHATGGDAGGTQSAANLLMARAQAGLAGMEAEDLAFAYRRTLDGVTAVRGLLDRYLSEQAAAAALEKYDPAPELAELDKQIRSREEETARVVQEKQALEKALADLDAKAKSESDKARAERMEETALRQRAVNLRAVEQAEVIEQATQRKRAADAHDKEASLLRAQIAQRQPEVGELQSLINRLTEQRRLLDEAKGQVQAFAKSTAERAAASRAAAMKAAEEIRAALAELDKTRAPVAELAEKVAGGYDQAASASKAAGRGSDVSADTRSQANLSAASNQHAKADVLAVWAQAQDAYADLLRSLADATPELPGAADLRKQADGAEQKTVELRQKAEEALKDATEAYGGAGGRGEARERLDRLKEKLAELDTVRKDPSKLPPEAAPTGAAPTTPSAEPVAAASGGEEAEIRAMLGEMARLQGSTDFAASKPYLHASSAAGRDFMALAEKMAGAAAELEAAMKEKFGTGLAGDMAGMSGPLPKFDLAGVSISVVSPTAATLMMPTPTGQQVPVAVVKVDGKWKLDMDSLATTMGPMIEPVKRMAAPMAAAFRQVAADVRAGKYSTKEEVQQALMTQIMPLMMGSGRGGGG